MNKISKQRLTIKEASEVLGITEPALRQRIRRGQYESEKDDDGRIYVWLEVQSMSQVESNQALLEAKDETIAHLNEQLSFLRAELERKDHLLAQMNANIAALTERIPAIEPPAEVPPDEPESPVTASEEGANAQVPPEPETAEPQPWWRRIFR